MGAQFALNRFEEAAHPKRDVADDAVYEEGWRRSNATALAAVDVLTHALQVYRIVDLGDESRHVEPNVSRISVQVSRFEMTLVSKQEIVHPPEFSLCRRGLGGLCGH